MIGYTKSDLDLKLDHLYSASIYQDDVSDMFSALRKATSEYFLRGNTFKEQAYNTFRKVVIDATMRKTGCSKEHLLPAEDTNYPDGYENVGLIFHPQILQEIMAVTDSNFNSAYYRKRINDTLPYQYEMHNTYLEDWAQKIKEYLTDELEALRTLEQYCYVYVENKGLAFSFEDCGAIYQPSAEDKKKIMEDIYTKRGWNWLENMFHVGIFKPSYIN